jgi:ferritin-like metal-binding protein YciE
MTEANQKIVQYLNEAHANEQALTRVLESQIAMAPRSGYRKVLQTHLRETRDHARRVEKRLGELRQRDNLVQFGIGLLETALGQSLAFGRAPIDLLRRSGGPERVVKNAKDACATEALEIATYAGIEQLAESTGDKQTAKLAASIRAEEQKMLDSLLQEIPRLVSWAVDAEVRGKASAAISENGATAPTRTKRRSVKKAPRRTKAPAKRKARQARKVPVVAKADGQTAGGIAPGTDLPISNYQTLTADEIVQRLGGLSQIDLARIDAFERNHESRAAILTTIATVRGDEPWRRSDDRGVTEVGAALNELTRA